LGCSTKPLSHIYPNLGTLCQIGIRYICGAHTVSPVANGFTRVMEETQKTDLTTEAESAARRAHLNLVRAAERYGAFDSVYSPGVSRHSMTTITFEGLEALYTEAKKEFSSVLIGAQNGRLTLSARKLAPPKVASGNKRAREDDIEDSVHQLLKPVALKLPTDELNACREVLIRLKRDLRGTQGEDVVLSLGVEVRKLRSNDDKSSLVVIARLAAGVAVSLARIKAALGNAWLDGLASIERAAFGIGEELPLSDEARAAEALGGSAGLLLIGCIKKKTV
jgi:hypothetical protein